MQTRRQFAIRAAITKKESENKRFKIVDHVSASNHIFENREYTAFKMVNGLGEVQYRIVSENMTPMYTSYNVKLINTLINELKAR